jgi:predicted RNase H-like nuclease (RuvC/YqgF family)
MNEALPIIGGIAGLSTLILGVLAYFKWKPKHPIDVRAAQVTIDTAKIENDNRVIKQLEEGYDRLSQECNSLRKDVNECNRKHAEAEQQLRRIMSKCKLNCLVE